MAALSPVSKTGITAALTMVAATGGGDTMDNTNGPVTLVVNNASGSPITVTVASQATVIPAGTAKADLATSVAAGKLQMIGPLDPAIWSNNTNQVVITYSGVTTLTIAGVVPH